MNFPSIQLPLSNAFMTNVASNCSAAFLSGVVAYVDVRSPFGNPGIAIADRLKSLGASVDTTKNPFITHVIFRNGDPDTRAWAERRGIFVVSPAWVKACVERKHRVPELCYYIREKEDNFLVDDFNTLSARYSPLPLTVLGSTENAILTSVGLLDKLPTKSFPLSNLESGNGSKKKFFRASRTSRRRIVIRRRFEKHPHNEISNACSPDSYSDKGDLTSTHVSPSPPVDPAKPKPLFPSKQNDALSNNTFAETTKLFAPHVAPNLIDSTPKKELPGWRRLPSPTVGEISISPMDQPTISCENAFSPLHAQSLPKTHRFSAVSALNNSKVPLTPELLQLVVRNLSSRRSLTKRRRSFSPLSKSSEAPKTCPSSRKPRSISKKGCRRKNHQDWSSSPLSSSEKLVSPLANKNKLERQASLRRKILKRNVSSVKANDFHSRKISSSLEKKVSKSTKKQPRYSSGRKKSQNLADSPDAGRIEVSLTSSKVSSCTRSRMSTSASSSPGTLGPSRKSVGSSRPRTKKQTFGVSPLISSPSSYAMPKSLLADGKLKVTNSSSTHTLLPDKCRSSKKSKPRYAPVTSVVNSDVSNLIKPISTRDSLDDFLTPNGCLTRRASLRLRSPFQGFPEKPLEFLFTGLNSEERQLLLTLLRTSPLRTNEALPATNQRLCGSIAPRNRLQFEPIKTVWRFADKFNINSTTHLICCTPYPRTINLFKCILAGIPVVDRSWLVNSAQQGQWLSHNNFLVPSLPQPYTGAHMKTLFATVGSIFCSPGISPASSDLMELIGMGGGLSTRRLLKADLVVGTFDQKKTCVTSLWILDSILHAKLLPFKKYAVTDFSC